MTTATLAPEVAAELPPEPYPGLRPFEPTEWAIFFGREPMTDEVIAHLAAQHLVVVHGASGCGKSSLVRAGVLPWLRLDYACSGKPWKTAVARPSGGPLRNIARAFAQELGPLPGPSSSDDAASAWHDRLALGRPVLDDIGEALRAQGGASLCLLIDQFEELFRYAREQRREEAQLLVEILEAVADPEIFPRGLFLIITMRSDYMATAPVSLDSPRSSTAASISCHAWTSSPSCAPFMSRRRCLVARSTLQSVTASSLRPGRKRRTRCPCSSTP